jgi:hypothetical protein
MYLTCTIIVLLKTIHNKQIKGYKKMYMTDHTFIFGFCTCKSVWLLTEFYVVINKTDKTLITCLLIFLFSIGNCHFNDIWHFVDWINFIGLHGFYQCTLFCDILKFRVYLILKHKTQISLEQIFICVVLFFLCLVILSVQINIYIVY